MTREEMETNVAQADLLKDCQKELESTLRYDCHNDYIMEKLLTRIKSVLGQVDE